MAPQKTSGTRLSVIQVMASALTAVTSTVALSYLSAAGTILGAAIAAVITVTGNYAYGRWLQRGKQAAKAVARQAVTLVSQQATESDDVDYPQDGPDRRFQQGEFELEGPNPRQGELDLESVTEHTVATDDAAPPATGWWAKVVVRYGLRRSLLVAGLAVFMVIMAVITVFELIAGKTLSDELTGNDSGRGTTINWPSRPRSTPGPTPGDEPTDQQFLPESGQPETQAPPSGSVPGGVPGGPTPNPSNPVNPPSTPAPSGQPSTSPDPSASSSPSTSPGGSTPPATTDPSPPPPASPEAP